MYQHENHIILGHPLSKSSPNFRYPGEVKIAWLRHSADISTSESLKCRQTCAWNNKKITDQEEHGLCTRCWYFEDLEAEILWIGHSRQSSKSQSRVPRNVVQTWSIVYSVGIASMEGPLEVFGTKRRKTCSLC